MHFVAKMKSSPFAVMSAEKNAEPNISAANTRHALNTAIANTDMFELMVNVWKRRSVCLAVLRESDQTA